MKNIDINKLKLRKNEIEKWYHEGFPNYNLIAGLDSQKERLTELRNLKCEREKLYDTIEAKSPLALTLFLDEILSYPDIVSGKRLKAIFSGKKSKDKILAGRDYLDSEKRQAAKLYKKAIKNIQNAVDRENKKLKEKYSGFTINPINVKIHNPYGIESVKGKPPEKSIQFIKTLSNILSPCFESQADRARIVAKVFQLIYGVPETHLDHKNIARQC